MTADSAILSDIRSLSSHDGPGLRTTLFFKGCSLNCKWCHNPETISAAPELEWDNKSCIDCRTCQKKCPENAILFFENQLSIIDRDKCKVCGVCVEVCPSKALKQIGQRYTIHQLLVRVRKDELFIKRSNGGVTFSGGEPALQYPFIAQMAKKLRAENYHLALDTCGLASVKAYETLIPLIDLVLFDLKVMNDDRHRAFTGGSNSEIHRNLKRILEIIEKNKLSTQVWIRTPLIPGMTDDEKNIQAIGKCISEISGVSKWDLCTFNNMCVTKYRKLGRQWELESSNLLTKFNASHLLRIAKLSVPHSVSVTLSGLTT